MEKHYNLIKGFLIVFITVVIISLIYATLTKRITMRENDDYKKGYAWKVSFKNLERVKTVGSAHEKIKPTINRNDTRISTYSVSLANPGDSVTYVFDVVNEGNYNALISAIYIPKPICMGNVTDAKNVCRHLKYTLNYIENPDDMYNLGSDLHIGDTLYKGQSRKLKLTLSYDSNVTGAELAKGNVEIYNLDIAIIYSECDEKCNVRGYNAPQ